MNERKLNAWVEAGLIDAGQAIAIRTHEAAHSRPLALWAVIGIGALAIGLGLVSLVAANWDAIPAMARLGVHMTLLAGAALALWWRRESADWTAEALLFVFGALGLTFMGHVGQAYQTASPLWQPLTLWLALFGVLFLLRGASWLTAAALGGILIVAVWDFADGDKVVSASVLAFAMPTALPLALAPLGAAMRASSARQAFWRRIEQIGFAYALGGASLIAVLAGFDRLSRQADAMASLWAFAIWGGAALAAAFLTRIARRDAGSNAAAGMLLGAAAVTLLAWPLSGNAISGALLFMGLWIAVAGCALRGGWRGVFQLAVALIALRLIVLSFELGDDLLTSGAGLITSGVLILVIAGAAVRIARRYAPPRDAAA